MSAPKLPATIAACVLALSPGSGLAQNPALTTAEGLLRAKEAAAAAAARPLVEADKRRPRIGGFWILEQPVPALRTLEGKIPAMTAQGRALYAQRLAARKAGRSEDPGEVCLPPGTPRSMWSGQPFLITQAPAKITFFHEFRHTVRHVFLDGPLKADNLDPRWQGLSSGYWTGDDLMIETAGFNGKQWLDDAGLPQSAGMKVTERLRLVAPDTLEDQVAVVDPAYYARPWTTAVRFKRLPANTNLIEEECSEKLLEFPLRNYAPGE